MSSIVKTLINICLLRDGPDQLPASYVLLSLLVVISLVVSTLIGTFFYSLQISGVSSIAGLFFSFVFAKLLLFKKPERFMQTFTAMLGTAIIIHILSLPSVYSLTSLDLNESSKSLFSITSFALLVWNVIVYGYIFSKALSSVMSYGVAISVGYTLLSLMIVEYFIIGNVPT